MAVRTSDTAVKAILGRHYDTTKNLDLTPFIETASNLVDWVQDCATTDLSTTTAELVERWLAAHLYAYEDQLFQSKNTGDAGATYQGQTGMVLNSTQYGQMAMTLDTTGCLAKRSKEVEQGSKNKASIHWLGTEIT